MERAELARLLGSKGQEAGSKEPVLISGAQPEKFMAAFAAVVSGEGDVFLCDPQWGTVEKAQLAALLQSKIQNPKPEIAQGWLMIPTGGSSGQLKFACHDQHTLAAAVRGFTGHFGLAGVNAAGVLPLHHVSGLMAWLRCALTGGEYRPLEWKAVEQGTLPELPPKPDGWVVSLVPTQLERLMRQPAAVEWLAKFRIVLLGGAPAPAALLDRAAAAGIRLALVYGMTETAAMVTALRPEEFLAGGRSSGRALPHVTVSLGEVSTIMVAGESLFRGYYPEWRTERVFATGDTGRFDESGNLTVLGRKDGVIISGGEKIQPAEVELALLDSGGLTDVVVMGVPDAEWGEIVVAAYPASVRPDVAKLQQAVERLATHKRPKHFLALESWPLTAAGKVNRAEVVRIVTESLNTKKPSS